MDLRCRCAFGHVTCCAGTAQHNCRRFFAEDAPERELGQQNQPSLLTSRAMVLLTPSFLGTDKKAVWVAVISGKQNEKPQLLSFPIGTAAQDGFCSVPSRIRLDPHVCETPEGPLSGCKKAKSCHDLAIIDNDCDSFNFYWDSSRKEINWWRN